MRTVDANELVLVTRKGGSFARIMFVFVSVPEHPLNKRVYFALICSFFNVKSYARGGNFRLKD